MSVLNIVPQLLYPRVLSNMYAIRITKDTHDQSDRAMSVRGEKSINVALVAVNS